MTGRIPVLDDRGVEQLLSGRPRATDADLLPAVELLRSVASGPAPAPGTALAQLLDTGFEPEVVPLRRPVRRRTWAARAGAALTASAASLLVTGTAAALPAPLQDGLADLVSALTPFELPRPDAPEETPRPVSPDDATSSPTPTDVPSPSARATPTVTDEEGAGRTADRTAGGQRTTGAQRPAEEAADASEDAADDAADAADAARDREEAAEDAAREREEAARDAAREAEEEADRAEDEREDAETGD